MARLVKDLLVKVGTYQDKNGEQKNRYKNVGSILEGDDGGNFILLDRSFNPAGVPNPDDRDTLIINMYDPKPKDGTAPAAAAPAPAVTKHNQAKQNGYAPKDVVDLDDDMPF